MTEESGWPDKVMFASILLILAGAFGLIWAAMSQSASIGDRIPRVFATYPVYLELPLSIATCALGMVALRRQDARLAYAGGVTGIASLGFVGLTPLLALVAMGILVRGRLSPSSTRPVNRVATDKWPDKALAASLFILVTGLIALFQGLAIAVNRFDPILFSQNLLAAGYDIPVGLFCLYGAYEVYHLRRAWTGWLAAGLGFLTLGFYIIGPILAATAMIMLQMATREHEFDAAGDQAAKPKPAKRAGRAG